MFLEYFKQTLFKLWSYCKLEKGVDLYLLYLFLILILCLNSFYCFVNNIGWVLPIANSSSTTHMQPMHSSWIFAATKKLVCFGFVAEPSGRHTRHSSCLLSVRCCPLSPVRCPPSARRVYECCIKKSAAERENKSAHWGEYESWVWVSVCVCGTTTTRTTLDTRMSSVFLDLFADPVASSARAPSPATSRARRQLFHSPIVLGFLLLIFFSRFFSALP